MDDGLVFLGIDFGTSKCVMSWYNPNTGRAEIILNSNDREETPPLIYFGGSKKDMLVGQDAVDKLENTVNFSSLQFVSVKRNIKENLDFDLDDDTTYSPTDFVKELFLKLKGDAELRFAKQPITRTVITYPELFGAPQRDSIAKAAKDAGFAEVELLSEPVAAVMAYCSTVQTPGKRFLVYDFGAGTANIAIIERSGDNFLPIGLRPRELINCGGDNLNRILYKYCEELLQSVYHRPISFTPGQDDPRFLRACCTRKEGLWNTPQPLVEFSSSLLDQDGKRRVTCRFRVDRTAYEHAIEPEIKKTITSTQEILDQTGANSIDEFLVIGGTSRIPLVTKLLAEIGIDSAALWNQSWERDFAVALGAAYYGSKVRWDLPRIQKPQAGWGAQNPFQPQQQNWAAPARPKQQASWGAQGTQGTQQQPAWGAAPSSSTPDPWAQLQAGQPWGIQQPQVQPQATYGANPPSKAWGQQPTADPWVAKNPAKPSSLNKFAIKGLFTLFILLFGVLAVAQYIQGKDISVILHPWIASPYPLPWWVTVALVLVSLVVLFNRSSLGMFLTAVFFGACLAMTILIPLGFFSLTIPFVSWIGPNIPWWVCGLLASDLFGLIRLRLGRK